MSYVRVNESRGVGGLLHWQSHRRSLWVRQQMCAVRLYLHAHGRLNVTVSVWEHILHAYVTFIRTKVQ